MNLSALNERSDQTLNAASRGPFAKVTLASNDASDDDEAQSKAQFDSMNQSQFNFGAINRSKNIDGERIGNQSPTTAQFAQRPLQNKMLTLDINQATHSHYPAIDGNGKNPHTTRNVASRNNSFATTDQINFIGSSELPKMNHSFLSVANNKSPPA